MSHHIAIPNSEKFDSKKAASLKTIFQLMAVIGLIGAGIVGFASPKLFAFSWLFAFFFGFTICLGCFFWNCLHHATDSEWSVVIRRQMENVSALLKVVAVLFIPIAAILVVKPDLLYSWIKPHLEDSLMQGTKGKYLTSASSGFVPLESLDFCSCSRPCCAIAASHKTRTVPQSTHSQCARRQSPAFR